MKLKSQIRRKIVSDIRTSKTVGGININNINNNITDAVRIFFEKNKKGSYNVNTISNKLNIPNEPAIAKALTRLCKSGFIIRTTRGFYRYNDTITAETIKEDFDDIPEGFHGIKLIATRLDLGDLEVSPQFWTSVKSSQNEMSEDNNILQRPLDDFLKPIGNKLVKEYPWRERVIRVEISKYKIEIHLRNSEKQLETIKKFPLSVPELDAFLSFLEAVFNPRFYEYEWKVISYGIATDYHNLKIDGATSITLQTFKGYIQRWYDKKKIKVARREIHTNKAIPLEECIRNLKGESPIGVAELCDRVDGIDSRLDELMAKLQKLMEIIVQKTDEPLVIKW